MGDKTFDRDAFLGEAEAMAVEASTLIDRIADDGEVILTPGSVEASIVAQLAEQWAVFYRSWAEARGTLVAIRDAAAPHA